MNIDAFHFLRPEWLLALIPLALFCLWLWRQAASQSNWRKVVSPNLLPHLLVEQPHRTAAWSILTILLGGILSILAMAGPTWERLPQPVFRDDAALVLVLDLSQSMTAEDIKPSRIERSHYKITDIIRARKEGQVALIVYAGDAFTVTPLTDDDQTILSQLNVLTPALMPAQGSRVDRALELAADLLRQAGLSQGDVLLITDEVSPATGMAAAKTLTDQGDQLSILGVGTREGAPIPLRGSMLQDDRGEIVIPQLNTSQLQQIARAGGGRYATVTNNDSDIRQLNITQINRLDESRTTDEDNPLTADVWKEFGPWLLLPVLPLAALVFRRGVLVIAILFLVPLPQPVQASGSFWENLWSTQDQRAQALIQKQPAEAAKLFADPAWRGGAHYKSDNYQEALNDYQSLKGTDARYNEGNTLARLGEFEAAINAYDKSLKLDPNNEDAKHNRDVVAKALEDLKRQQSKQDQSQQNQTGQDQQQQDSQNKQDQSQQNPSQQGQQQDNAQQGQPQDEGQQADSQSAQSEQEQSSQQQAGQQSEQESENEQPSASAQNQNDEQNKADEQTAGERALAAQANKDQQDKTGDEDDQQRTISQAEALDEEQRQARELWLNRIPDDPAGLLKRKFKYQYQQRAQRSNGDKTW